MVAKRLGCLIDGCDSVHCARGWCQLHYDRWKRYGDPLVSGNQRPIGLTEAEVFRWFMPGDPPNYGCWDWSGTTRSGYGNFHMMIDGRRTTVSAHVASYRTYIGPIPDGLFVLHSCDRPVCVQPKHLRAGTHMENVRDMVDRNRVRRGESHPGSKLTDEKVLLAKRHLEKTSEEMAKELGVSQSTVCLIRKGKRWSHVRDNA